ncbi:MAG: cytotoxin [Deltaproteobacteria bacterium]|nr:cytotoxin [Deltaproteobacteria bacterium]
MRRKTRRLRVPDDVASLIRGLHPDLKRRLRRSLDDIVVEPEVGKPLRDELAGLRSCRSGRLRIIYEVTEAVIVIVAIGPRRTIYQETWRRVRRQRRP